MSPRKRDESARARLVHHVQELERLEEEKRAAAAAFRDGFKLAAAAGFDEATLKAVLKLRKLTPTQRKERRALEAIYMASLGMLDGDALPDEARRRLDKQDPPPPSAAPEMGDDSRGDDPSKASPAPATQMPLLPPKDPAEALQEGRDAAAAGKRVYDNPYPAGDPCRAAWDEGWCEASGSHGMDTPSAFQRRKEKPPDAPDEEGDGKKAA